MKLVLTTITAAVLLAVAAPFASASLAYTYSPYLGASVHQALEFASQDGSDLQRSKRIPKPVEVRCYTSATAFDLAALRHGESYKILPTLVAFYQGGTNVFIRSLTCTNAVRFTQGIFTPTTANAFATVLHESLHRQGFYDEHITEEYALGAMYAAGHLFRYVSDSNKGLSPTADSTTRGGWNAFYLALGMNHATTSGKYRVGEKEAIQAKEITWAAIV
jgi:hypothetical protein